MHQEIIIEDRKKSDFGKQILYKMSLVPDFSSCVIELNISTFEAVRKLEIGCGIGNYLTHLQ